VLLIDAHVHLHASYDTRRFLDFAARNFATAATRLGISGQTGVLLFGDGDDGDSLARLALDFPTSGQEKFSSTAEDCSAFITLRDGTVLLVVAGRQVVTRERLEVLALGTSRVFAAGCGFLETLRPVLDTDALAVVPWGFGKWWGRRGRLVERALTSPEFAGLLVGDNGGRPRGGRTPRLLRLARELDILDLPGSDPLPSPRQECRVASYGCVLECSIDAERPARSIKRYVKNLRHQPQKFGRLTAPVSFAMTQVRHLLESGSRDSGSVKRQSFLDGRLYPPTQS
jgi:hypothetical protein